MPITVLVVDDSKLARIVVGKTLKALRPDWERVEASNADQALSSFDAKQIDLALIDYNLPGRNGLELVAVLRARNREMLIAIITANVQDEVYCGRSEHEHRHRHQADHRRRAAHLSLRGNVADRRVRRLMEEDVVLNEPERDALIELVNIGVGRAATSLRKMVGKPVLLSCCWSESCGSFMRRTPDEAANLWASSTQPRSSSPAVEALYVRRHRRDAPPPVRKWQAGRAWQNAPRARRGDRCLPWQTVPW
jgi:CheY-like chemotaxis protein